MTTTSPVDEDTQSLKARTRIGDVLQDKWKIDSLLGVGGMAAVYAATHRNGKRVAVKMLHPEFSHDVEMRDRFLREGYAANTIQHDGAVSVLDDDVAPDGSAFIVMELLDGETVEQRWEKSGQRLPVGEVLSIVDQLLDVLVAAHEKSVVHRDIKPENLFVTKTGVLKVLDFGIAKVYERSNERQSTTRAGMVMGTPAFMAPEQALAHWDEVDGRTDLWAVGATMFMLLSGRHVHVAQTSQEQLILSATAPAPALATAVLGVQAVPAQVAAIVDRALAFDRAARWPTARQMQDAVRVELDVVSGGEPSAPSGRRTSATLLGNLATGARNAPFVAPTLVDTAGIASGVGAWTQERDARTAELTRLRATMAESQDRYAAAKKATAEAQKTLEAARSERTSLEQWFTRQVGTRTAAVEEARHAMRQRLVVLARQELADRTAFGPELDAARDAIATVERSAASAERDVVVHEAAIDAYDTRSMRSGVILLGVAFVLALALLVAPIVWRATRVVDALPAAHSLPPH